MRSRVVWLVVLAVAGGFGLIVSLTAAAFVIDQARDSGKVARNVVVGGRNVSSMAEPELAKVLVEVERGYASTPVMVGEVPTGGFITDAGTIGLRVDTKATAERVMAAGREGSLPGRWWSWLASLVGVRRSELALTVDRTLVAQTVAEKDDRSQHEPVEAAIQLNGDGRFVGVAGKPGQGIDADRLAEDLLVAGGRGAPIKVTPRSRQVASRFTKADADRLAARAEELVAKPLQLVAEGATGSLSTGTLRSLLSSTPGTTALELRVDETAAGIAVEKAMPAAGSPPVEPTFKVEADSTLVLVPGAPGRGCCGPEAARSVGSGLLGQIAQPVQLTLVDKQPRLTNERAAALGVKEEVSSFATKHACCQPRVENIHRIADIVRGQVIPPGESFSINGFVGPRTTEKGFVVDKVIEDGLFTKDVGGGVSQFATTLFNAAWFAGMEFGEYQSHSLFISRYPKGREATLGFPRPDLVIKNPSPYAVMMWPTYTDTEIRVSLYSTKWVNVEAVGQDTNPFGSCTVYTAKRQRTFLDGRVAIDSTKAQYRRREGQDCR